MLLKTGLRIWRSTSLAATTSADIPFRHRLEQCRESFKALGRVFQGSVLDDGLSYPGMSSLSGRLNLIVQLEAHHFVHFIQTRRATRQTRPALKDDENANARPSRIITRSKPPSNSTTTAPGVSTRASVLADATAQNKRKREALGEVTGKAVNNRVKAALDTKGKGKETVASKPTKPASGSSTATATTTTTTTSRVPLRPVSKPSSSKPAVAKHAKVKSNAVILEPASKSVPVVEIPIKPTTATTTTRRAISRPATNVNAATTAATSTTTVKPRRVIQKKVHTVYVDKDLQPPSEEPVAKKRRTSSEAPDEARLEAIAEEPEAPLDKAVVIEQPNLEDHVQDWDDLDRDDDDDPLMVSEYVTDIFNYLKQLEVNLFCQHSS